MSVKQSHNDVSEAVAEEISAIIYSVTGADKAALHEPSINESEAAVVAECIAGGFVSSVGPAITQFEHKLCEYTNASHAIAVVNGTAALHLMLLANGVRQNDEVLVPALTFVASGNAILQAGATPHFIDSQDTDLGVDVCKLESYLNDICEMRDGVCVNQKSGRNISCIMPVHVFGHIGDMDGLRGLSEQYNINLIEDAAEALGSWKNGRHAGLFGRCGALSFNGNKIITTGGGGAVITNDSVIAERVRTLATTAKRQHSFEYWHDELAYNYRMPALNAAFGTAQIKKLDLMLNAKARLNKAYKHSFRSAKHVTFFDGPKDCQANNWLNAICLDADVAGERDNILQILNIRGYGCRPVWTLLSQLPHFKDCPAMALDCASELAMRLINIPSSAKLLHRLAD